MNTTELWTVVLGDLELSLSKANFTTWFKKTFIADVETNTVIVGVPNMFTQAWLEKKYTKSILKTIQNFTDGEIKYVTYRVEAQPTEPQNITISSKEEKEAEQLQQEEVQTQNFVRNANQQTKEVPTGEFCLNNKYCFETFIVGKQNELAHAAAQAVSGQPGDVYNPLFIYSSVGMGKTHLLNSIGLEVGDTKKIMFISAERFMYHFIRSIKIMTWLNLRIFLGNPMYL